MRFDAQFHKETCKQLSERIFSLNHEILNKLFWGHEDALWKMVVTKLVSESVGISSKRLFGAK